jgi:DNA-binding CsgD family transcriptional regulator
MLQKKTALQIIGGSLIGISALLVIFSFIPGFIVRAASAIVALSMAVTLFFLIFALPDYRRLIYGLFVPAMVCLTIGIVLLLNAITNDTSSWAYAWMFCLSGLGVGLALATRFGGYPQILYTIGYFTGVVSAALFAIFGIIVGGPFMQIVSLILMAIEGGLLFRMAHKKTDDANLVTESLESMQIQNTQPQSEDHPVLVEPLSKREIEVLKLIEQGLSNQEIAERMVIAQSTVKTHINNIYSKLNAQSRTQAMRRAKELGLL